MDGEPEGPLQGKVIIKIIKVWRGKAKSGAAEKDSTRLVYAEDDGSHYV